MWLIWATAFGSIRAANYWNDCRCGLYLRLIFIISGKRGTIVAAAMISDVGHCDRGAIIYVKNKVWAKYIGVLINYLFVLNLVSAYVYRLTKNEHHHCKYFKDQ